MIESLYEGVRRFRSQEYPRRPEFFQGLAAGQEPIALMITCIDSRVDPNLFTQSPPGRLLVARNPGNLVPPAGSSESGSIAAIEFAMTELKIEDIIVCGHSQCAAVGLIPGDLFEDQSAMRAWLNIAGHRGLKTASPEEAEKHNVLQQLANLRTHPSVSEAEATGRIRLHGWHYDIPAGAVSVYDQDTGVFAPLTP
jgi:carbonic anhydrase